MFPFWNTTIAPVLKSAGVRRLVEIGALRGENTRQIIEHLGPETELHVIDPVPDFDPDVHVREFGGQYVFHRDLSLNVLGDLPPMDAALIDGDHNWYTVYNELRLLRDVSRRNDAPLPLLVLHDVGWPYGRRDLYYNPDDIPDEFRHPWRDAGIRPGRRKLVDVGGLNPTMHNAEVEGGPRNGVRAALDDFLDEHDRPYRAIVIPIYFGLAIVAEDSLLDRHPALREVLDHIETSAGKDELLDLAEDVRIRAMLFQHNVYFRRDERVERTTAKYLDTVKAALLDEHYLENEARLLHLSDRIASGRAPETRMLRDPIRQDRETYSALVRARTGPAGPGASGRSFLPFTDMGRTQLDHLESCLDTIRDEGVDGDLVECGTGRGGGAVFMRAWLDGHEQPDRLVWVADEFRSSEAPRLVPNMPEDGIPGFQADLNLVRDAFDRFSLLDRRVRFLQGPVADTLPGESMDRIALLRIGPGLGADAGMVLERLLPLLAPGAFVVIDDGAGTDAQRAVDSFRSEQGIREPATAIDADARFWRTAEATEVERPLPEPRAAGGRGPAATDHTTTDQELDLTVVVVFYNMRREARRTLQSLSRAYQEGIHDLSYEVLVVDNGSSPEEKLTPDDVAGFGPEFRLIDMGDDARPSPVRALNVGISSGRGQAFALMIDGAHVLTPGVLRFGMDGLRTYEPAIVLTQQWYTGPGQQGDAMQDGYDRNYEDRLFERIEWPRAGYRLFEIGHFVGDRDWFDGLWESNCIFVERRQIEQVGGFDESFDVAGGGYANLELYERLGSSAGITVASILGEGSFHQLHGGTTTNEIDPAQRRSRVYGYSQQFAELRGRPFRGPGKPIHYVGRIMSPSARRSKPRRLSAKAFAAGKAPGAPDGPPTSPLPVPDELRWDFTDAVWRSLPWSRTTWLGERVESAPTDLLAYQELIHRVRPDLVVVTGPDAGRAAFLASMCELIGHGTVLTVDPEMSGTHPRIEHLAGDANDPTVVAAVTERARNDRGLVILGSRADRLSTARQFEAYASIVPVGSYVVVADTIVNGHPVWTGFGPGPAEAVKQILTKHGDFAVDPSMEKYSLSFNPSGFLCKVR